MARFLLIHGSCHGAWCWRDVLPHLHAAGHRARAIDLPSHGDDPTPAGAVTLDLYADVILAAIDAAWDDGAEDGPLVLVGHSMAGYPVSLAAERAPEKIARLVYLCAYVPAQGLSLADMRRAGPRQPLLDAIQRSADGLTFTIDPEKAVEKFYHDCPEIAGYALPRLCPQPILPQETPLMLTDAYGSVGRHYILCTDDRTIPPEYQSTMTGGWPEGRVSTMDSSHSPFFSAPAELAARLVRIAEGP
ncbi:alpha/beta fold hydrolase [Halodurantibacterium flavum]|uniref:Alpha/beta fold hydrolase n=1 Tax=Halodurantibacterium flavum TaxID=1382802 RepID=A0ABW4S270_9RHOB